MSRRRLWAVLILAIATLMTAVARPAPAMAADCPCPKAAAAAYHHPMRAPVNPAAPCAVCAAGCLPAQPAQAGTVSIRLVPPVAQVRWFDRIHLPDGLTIPPDTTPPRA
ncbi:MAG: hypothetical protein P4L73_17725 [Caulobacteraceae bacterium]|nr:hypothetical protein [Caulobacteraceae bacterium]